MTKEKAIEILESVTWSGYDDKEIAEAVQMGAEALKEQRPRGEWLSHYDYCKKHEFVPSGLIAFWWCNQCEQGVEIKTNFCPKCGTPMTDEAFEKYNGMKEKADKHETSQIDIQTDI